MMSTQEREKSSGGVEMVEIIIHPKKLNPDPPISGFLEGYVLDLHSTSMASSADPYFPTSSQRTPLGELLYQLKYDKARSNDQRSRIAAQIVDILKKVIKNKWNSHQIHCIVPSPPSLKREIQPVQLLARNLAESLSLPVEDVLYKVGNVKSMKDIEDYESRKDSIAHTLKGRENSISNKTVLFLDDIFDSGCTLRRSIEVLIKNCRARAVLVLVLTRTQNQWL